MKLNNRVFLILVLILFFTLTLNFNSVKAFDYDGQLPYLPSDLNSYYCIFSYNDNIYLIDTNRTNYFEVRGCGNLWVVFFENGYVLKNNSWLSLSYEDATDDLKLTDYNYGWNTSSTGYPISSGTHYLPILSYSLRDLSNSVIFNNLLIKHDVGYFSYSVHSIPDDYVFFQTAVVLVEGVQELPGVIAETLKVIIPVGLIVLAAILLIYLIRRVIYLSH